MHLFLIISYFAVRSPVRLRSVSGFRSSVWSCRCVSRIWGQLMGTMKSSEKQGGASQRDAMRSAKWPKDAGHEAQPTQPYRSTRPAIRPDQVGFKAQLGWSFELGSRGSVSSNLAYFGKSHVHPWASKRWVASLRGISKLI